VLGGVGANVGIKDVVRAASNDPGRVKVAAEADEGYGGADDKKVVAEEVDGEGEIFSGCGRAECEEGVCVVALEEEEGAAVAFGVEWVWRGNVHIPPFAILGSGFGGSIA